jgi:hypothetical protein
MPQTLTLNKPLTFGKVTIEKLTFRDETMAEDYLAFDSRGYVSQNIALIASLSGTEPEVVKKMSGRDYKAACKIVEKMLADDDAVEGEDAAKKPSES